MEAIKAGTTILGLIINKDETLQFCDMLIYGKVIIWSGMFKGLHVKQVSRLLRTANDQFPYISSIMGTVVTNCLTIGQYSDDFINAIQNYNRLGNFMMEFLEMYNPALRIYMRHLIPKDRSAFREL